MSDPSDYRKRGIEDHYAALSDDEMDDLIARQHLYAEAGDHLRKAGKEGAL